MTEDDDLELFRLAMRGVRPRAPIDRVEKVPPQLTPRPLQREADDRAVIEEMLLDPDPDHLEHGETLQYRGQGLPEATFRRLRRGQYRIERELDLHGLNRQQARYQVAEFLRHCIDHRAHCVRIIHGKGNGSPNSGPVLKTLLDGWLRKRKEVLAFCSARPVDGGSGAIYVLLRGQP